MINLTQDFVFETDNPDAVEQVLRAMIPILFKPNGQYVQLQIVPRSDKYTHAEDERDHEEFERRRRPVVDMGDHAFILGRSSCDGMARIYSVGSRCDDKAAAVKAINDKAGPNTLLVKNFWLATLSDYKTSCPYDGTVDCNNFHDLHRRAMDVVSVGKDKYRAEFGKLCGDGFDDCFNSFDGDVDVGYRLWHKPNGGWNKLQIGLCHIYYGK